MHAPIAPRRHTSSSLRIRAGAIRVSQLARGAGAGAPFPLNVRESTHSLLPTHHPHARARSAQVPRRSEAAATAPLTALAHEYARIHSLRSLSNHHAHALASLALCSFSPRAQRPRATHAIHLTPAHRNTRQGLGSCPLSAVHSRCFSPMFISASIRKRSTNVAKLGDWDLPEDFTPAGNDEQGGGIFAVNFWSDDDWGSAILDHALVLYGPDAPNSELPDHTDGFDLIPF